MITEIKRFLWVKLWRPIVDESVYYNPFNTTLYAGLFALAAAYLGWPALKKMDITLDKRFFIGFAPFVFLGGALRSLKDVNILNTILLETPFIYAVLFVFFLGAIYVSRKIEDYWGVEYHKVLGAIGITSLLPVLALYSVSNTEALLFFIGLTSFWVVAGYIGLRFVAPGVLKARYTLPVAAHYFDATSTFVALQYPSTAEKHVLGRFFIDVFGPSGMFLMKTLIIIPAVYYINKELESEERNYYLFLIAVLGFAIGTRNILSLIALT